jgi:plasmid stabilization system protein ParE
VTLRVEVRRAAQSDINDAAAWYDEQRPGLGIEFLHELDAAFRRASDSPELYATVYLDMRRCATRRFPYNIFFRTRGSKLVVIAVFHASRGPHTWLARK